MAVVNFFTMPLMFTSNALFPKEAMPAWLTAVAQINPVTHAVSPIRAVLLFGWNWSSIWVSLVVIGGLALVMMIVAGQASSVPPWSKWKALPLESRPFLMTPKRRCFAFRFP